MPILLLVFLYFWPAWAASERQCRNRGWIYVISILFGWTIIGWFVCLIWAYSAPREGSRR